MCRYNNTVLGTWRLYYTMRIRTCYIYLETKLSTLFMWKHTLMIPIYCYDNHDKFFVRKYLYINVTTEEHWRNGSRKYLIIVCLVIATDLFYLSNHSDIARKCDNFVSISRRKLTNAIKKTRSTKTSHSWPLILQ